MSNQIQNFKKLIAFLKANDVNYALLGRKSSLREIINGDIDLVVSVSNFKKTEHLIEKFSEENNMKYIQCFQHETTAKYNILSDNIDHSIICPDICSHFVRDKRLLIKDDVLLNNTQETVIEELSLSVLSPKYEFLYYFLKKVDKAHLGKSEFLHILNQFNETSKDEIRDLLFLYFSKQTTKDIISCFTNKDYKGLAVSILKIKIELHSNTSILLSFYFKDLILKLKRVRYKTGLSIAVMGSDGSGKSTIITAITNNLNHAFRRIHYYHLLPVEVTNNNVVNTNPHAQKPYSVLVSIIKLLYLVYKYNKGYLKVNIKLIKSTLVIFDRYFNDIFVDKLRFRYKGSSILLKIAYFFIPKPKLYIYLDASPEIIYERKKELSVLELKRQREAYLSLFKNKKSAYIINAENNQISVIFDVEEVILNYLANRQKSRISKQS